MSDPLQTITHVINALSRWAVWAAGSLVFLTAILICVDVLGRSLFGRPVPGTFDLTGYMLAISTAWSFAFAHIRRANIRVDVAYALLPRFGRAALDIVSAASILLVAVLLSWHGWEAFEGTLRRASRVPFSVSLQLWYFQAMWLAGLCFFSLVSLLLFLLALKAFFSRQIATVRELVGVKSTDDEVNETLGTAAKASSERT